MQSKFPKFDKAMDWLSNRIIAIILIALLLTYVLYAMPRWYAYNSGQWKFFEDYHKHRNK